MSCSAWLWCTCKVYSTNRDCIRKTMAGSQCKPLGGERNFNGEEERGGGGEGGSLLLYWNFVALLGTIKDFIGYHTSVPYISAVLPIYIYWDWQGQKCKLKCPKIYEINSELYCNCNFCLYSFLQYKHLAFLTTSQEYICCSLKSTIFE